jgi:DeoR family transcriptional regulator of aga operon
VLLADGSKLGQVHLGVIGGVGEFQCLVTGGSVSSTFVATLEGMGMEVIVADATGPMA